MIAKYNGLCKVTNQVIIAGKTEIKKIGGQWQVVADGGKTLPAGSRVTSYGNEYSPHDIEEMEEANRQRELTELAWDEHFGIKDEPKKEDSGSLKAMLDFFGN